LREAGIEPEAIVALLARLGTAQPVEPIIARDLLIETFDLAGFGRAPARFDELELARLNAAGRPPATVRACRRAAARGMDETAWLAIRPNLERIADAADWWRVVTGPIEAPELDSETRAYLGEAARLLAWSADPWGSLTGALKEATGRKGKALFLPLRQALTGIDHGPDMHALLPLIGETEARRRLEAAASA
jgi:glutamyl-tRNA synthetase